MVFTVLEMAINGAKVGLLNLLAPLIKLKKKTALYLSLQAKD